MIPKLPQSITSASIDGERTNRVKLYGPKGGRKKTSALRARAMTPNEAKRATVRQLIKDPYPPDGAIIQSCFSLPEDEFVAMDELAARLRLQRSTLIRRALRAYRESMR